MNYVNHFIHYIYGIKKSKTFEISQTGNWINWRSWKTYKFSTDFQLVSSIDIWFSNIVAGTCFVLLRRLSFKSALELPKFLSVTGGGSTLISPRANDISCWISVHCSVSSFSTCEVSRGVCGTVLYCCKNESQCQYLVTHILFSSKTTPARDIENILGKLFTAIHLCFITSSMVSLMVGSVFNIPWIRLFASLEMFSHSGLGNSYWPERIRFFIPGEIARPWLL